MSKKTISYIDSTRTQWTIVQQDRLGSQTAFGFYPLLKGPRSIEADAANSLKEAKELIEHMAKANATERSKWENGEENNE